MAALIRPVRAHAPAPALLLGLALATAGCTNPFTPAKPEPPDLTAVREDFTTPYKLIETLRLAIENKGVSGAAAWADACADSTGPDTRAFYAFHDRDVERDWASVSHRDPPSPWDLRLERLFFDHFRDVLPFEYQMQWADDNTSPADDVDDAAGTALLHKFYIVEAIPPSGTPVDIAIGYADLHMVKQNSRWFLIRWQDRVDPSIGVNPVDPENRTMGWRRLDSQTQ